MGRPRQRTPELRDRIIVAAQATLARTGAQGFTTKQVADDAATSVPAIYELFGDKAGLIRELFLLGFRRLAEALAAVPVTTDPGVDLAMLARAYRMFARTNPGLIKVMFAEPFADFRPTAEDIVSADTSRRIILRVVRRCVDAGLIDADPIDVAHVVLATVQGMAAQEAAGWLGKSRASCDRRWELAIAQLVR
jgi:AcrR family transcriptional regulator